MAASAAGHARRKKSPVSVMPRPVPPALTMEFAGEMVSVVARASGPEGVRVDGLKVHVAPEGKPPVQAKVDGGVEAIGRIDAESDGV